MAYDLEVTLEAIASRLHGLEHEDLLSGLMSHSDLAQGYPR